MKTKEKFILNDQNRDGLDRRGFLECMAWAGTGMLWTVSGGLLGSSLLAQRAGAAEAGEGGFSFVQISDSHIGFNREGVNTDVAGTLKEAIARINALPQQPDFVLHTGDLTHLAAAEEFDTLNELLKSVKTQQILRMCRASMMSLAITANCISTASESARYVGHGWHSFDQRGVHFVGLVNVVDIQQNGLGALGAEQLAWLEADLKDRTSETPIVVFAHIPLWFRSIRNGVGGRTTRPKRWDF